MQERVESGLFKAFIEHQAIERFIINTHASTMPSASCIPTTSLVFYPPSPRPRGEAYRNCREPSHRTRNQADHCKNLVLRKELVAPTAEDSSAEPGKRKR